MKTLLKITSVSAILTTLAIVRMPYIHSKSLHTKDAHFGEALSPLNMVAMLGSLGFGALTILLLCVSLSEELFLSKHSRI